MQQLLILLFVTHAFCQNVSNVYYDTSSRNHFGEAAVGGLIPTSIMIIVMAVLRIVQLYQRRRLGIRPPGTPTSTQSST